MTRLTDDECVAVLLERAAKAEKPNDAMMLAQAALNAAHALGTIEEAVALSYRHHNCA